MTLVTQVRFTSLHAVNRMVMTPAESEKFDHMLTEAGELIQPVEVGDHWIRVFKVDDSAPKAENFLQRLSGLIDEVRRKVGAHVLTPSNVKGLYMRVDDDDRYIHATGLSMATSLREQEKSLN